MKRNLTFFLLFFGLVFVGQAQFNAYKYVVVPVKFDAFKQQNKYKTSTVTKFLLSQKGFNVVYSDNLPEDLKKNRCLGVYVDLLDDSSLFKTKTTLVFNDCDNKQVFKTAEGFSKIKEFEAAFKQSIDRAVNSMGNVSYTYEPKEEEVPVEKEETVTLNFKNDVKEVVEEAAPIEEVVIKKETTPTEQTYKAVEVAPSNISKAVEEEKVEEKVMADVAVLYAQPIENGYQLVDTTPKVVYILQETSVPDIYLVEGKDSGSGLIFKKEGKWFLEYTNDSGKEVKELNIKF